MAISITQQPTTPNAAYTSLPYVVSGSTTTGNPQYSYVMDIYESGSATRLNRVSQKPNPAGVAVFDPSRFLQSQLQYDNHWKITGSIDEVNSVKTFEIKFGEQYGTSTSSSITVYPNLATDELQVFPAVVDPNNGSSYNFNTSSYAGIGNTYLTNFPGSQTTTTVSDPKGYPYIIDSSDYMTVTAFKEDVGATGSINVNGYKIETGSISALVDTVSLSGSVSDEFVTFGVGPQNLSDLDSAFSASIANGSINTLVTTSDNGGITIMINNHWDGSSISSYDYSKTVQPRGTEYTRFAFINKLGFYDYYNVYSPLKRNSTVQRENVTLPKLDYSNLTSIYSTETRGETSYYNETNDSYTITTQWLDKGLANWLEELLESPEVYIQQGNDFVPIVITNSRYDSNQNTARNKTFQYDIEFKPANGNDLYSRETNCPPSPPVYVPVDPTPPVQNWKSWSLVTGSTEASVCGVPLDNTLYTVHTVERLDVGIEVFTSSSLAPSTQVNGVYLSDQERIYYIPPGNDKHITQNNPYCEFLEPDGLTLFYTAYNPGNKTTTTGSLEWHESYSSTGGPTGSVGIGVFQNGGALYQNASIGDLSGTADYWSTWGNCTFTAANCSKPVEFPNPFTPVAGTGNKNFTLQLYFRPGDDDTTYTNGLISMGDGQHDSALNVGLQKLSGDNARIAVWAKGDLGDNHFENFPSSSFYAVNSDRTFHTVTVRADNASTIAGLDFFLDETGSFATTGSIFTQQNLNIGASSDNYLGWTNTQTSFGYTGRQRNLGLMFYAIYDRALTDDEIKNNHRYFVSQSQGLT